MSDEEIESEYEAARAAFVKAHARMTAAKAAIKPVWEAQYQAKQMARLDVLAGFAEAFVAGKSEKELRRFCRGDMSALLREFWNGYLSHSEIYREHGDIGHKDWEKRVSLYALARRRDGRQRQAAADLVAIGQRLGLGY